MCNQARSKYEAVEQREHVERGGKNQEYVLRVVVHRRDGFHVDALVVKIPSARNAQGVRYHSLYTWQRYDRYDEEERRSSPTYVEKQTRERHQEKDPTDSNDHGAREEEK
jgi:hypothetical protein